MDEINKELECIESKINELKNRKLEIKEKMKKIRKGKNNKERTLPNVLRRMSTKFYNKMIFIDEKREEFGFYSLSLPEKTELITRHKDWNKIQEDMIHFNKKIEVNGGICNVI